MLCVMDALKIKEAHVLGNSLGAHIAINMALQAPQRIKSLTLIAQANIVEVCDTLRTNRSLLMRPFSERGKQRAICVSTVRFIDIILLLLTHIEHSDSWFVKADDGSDQLASDVIKGMQYMFFNDDSSSQSLIDEWVVSSRFKPSNPELITKVFSAVLDEKRLDISSLDSITCPVLILHGGAFPSVFSVDVLLMFLFRK